MAMDTTLLTISRPSGASARFAVNDAPFGGIELRRQTLFRGEVEKWKSGEEMAETVRFFPNRAVFVKSAHQQISKSSHQHISSSAERTPKPFG
jgi:putative IMPACT (imprinted ancient) family translation regulator